MKLKSIVAATAAFAVPLLVAGCGGISSVDLWPFGDGSKAERSRVPPNSTAYQCAGNKRFFLRYLDNGAAAWVILPEREFRLDRVQGEGTRYGNGKAVLTVSGDEMSLLDPPSISYTACKIPSAEPPKADAPKGGAPKAEPAK